MDGNMNTQHAWLKTLHDTPTLKVTTYLLAEPKAIVEYQTRMHRQCNVTLIKFVLCGLHSLDVDYVSIPNKHIG